MHCDLTLLQLEEYLDGYLDLPARRDVERHLSGCEPCADQFLQRALVREAEAGGHIRPAPGKTPGREQGTPA